MLAVIGGDRRRAPRPDPVKTDVNRRQWAVARRLAPIVGEPPERLLDYQRADGILERR